MYLVQSSQNLNSNYKRFYGFGVDETIFYNRKISRRIRNSALRQNLISRHPGISGINAGYKYIELQKKNKNLIYTNVCNEVQIRIRPDAKTIRTGMKEKKTNSRYKPTLKSYIRKDLKCDSTLTWLDYSHNANINCFKYVYNTTRTRYDITPTVRDSDNV